MQSNKFTIQAGGSATLPVTGSGFWFESGTTTTANGYIIVKPSTGGTEIRLKPGQNVNAIGDQAFWTITAEDPAAVITGYCIIGNGDFNDDNTANLVQITGVTNAQALPVKQQSLATMTHFTPVSINTGAAQALVNDPTQVKMRFRNTHASANVAIGNSTVTMANAAIVIPPGGTWVEDDAPGANWYAATDTSGAIIAVMGLKL